MAIVLLTIAGIGAARNTDAERDKTDAIRRNSAWSEMMMASRQADDASLITAAERFFSTSPGADSRAEEALQLYGDALLRWFAGLPGQPSAQDQERLRHYKDIAASLGGERLIDQLNPSDATSHPAGAAFISFPLNQPRPVEIDWGRSILRRGSNRDRMDQARDWLLVAVLSDAGLNPNEIRSVLIDLPPARFGYVEPISNFEYGDTRSRSIGQGRVVALVPARQARDERSDSLARIADEHQKNTGSRPRELLIFEYELADDIESATITRREPVPGNSLFTEASGYYTARITDQGSLEFFLKQVDDITEAQVKEEGVLVSGRKLRTGYRGVDLDDVAALWQSEAKLQQLRDKAKAFIEKNHTFNEKWETAIYHTESEKLQLEQQYKKETADLDAEAASLKAEFARERPANESGFSLDPTYDYEKLAKDAAPLLSKLRAASEQDKSKALQALQDHDEESFLNLLLKERQSKRDQSAFADLDELLEKDQFQAARYDGYLQGTRVGMTLFYTDLLAKLKAIDYWSDRTISDFRPLIAVHVASIYRKEEEALPNTRLWFGPQDRGYQLTSQGILFGRNGTRIYAASSDPLRPGKEAPPNASSQAFLGWWDCHYEEVARLEPEYQRLNEIMKWSLLLSWLSEHGGNALAYLDNVKVNRGLWFPDWAQQNHELRYRDWNRFKFYEKGYKGSATEAMPILHSKGFFKFDGVYFIIGGVSLAGKELIHERPLLAPEFQADELLLHPGRDFSKALSTNEISMLGGVKHAFTEESGMLSTLSTVSKQGTKFRENLTEIAPKPFERSYGVGSGHLDIDLRVGDADLGRFYTEVSPDQPIRLGFQAREIDRGQQFAEQISSAVARGEKLETSIATHPDVEQVLKFGPGIDCNECLLVKLHGSRGYLKLQPEQHASVDIPAGWQARAGSPDSGGQNFNLAWPSESHLSEEPKGAHYIRFKAPAGGSGGSIPPTFTRGPPLGSVPDNWNFEGRILTIFKDRKGNSYVPLEKFPEWRDPLAVTQLRNQLSGRTDQVQTLISFGDSRQALLAIADNPIEAKQTIDALKVGARSGLDHALAEADIGKARLNLKVLSQLEQGPDVKARVAIAATESGNVEDAVRTISDLLKRPGGNVEGVLNIINQRLQYRELSPFEENNLNQLASMLDLGSGHAYADRGVIAFDVRLTEQVANSRVLRSQDIHDAGPLYVLDSPSASRDVAMFAAMPDQIQRDLGRIVQLPRSDLAHAHPLVIETAEGQRYRLAGDTATLSGLPGPGPEYHRYNPNAPLCNSSSQQGDQSVDCRQQVYLFDPAPKQTAQTN